MAAAHENKSNSNDPDSISEVVTLLFKILVCSLDYFLLHGKKEESVLYSILVITV